MIDHNIHSIEIYCVNSVAPQQRVSKLTLQWGETKAVVNVAFEQELN